MHMILGISSSMIFKVMFSATEGYSLTKEKMNAHYGFMNRLINCKIDNGYSSIAIFILVYVILCIWVYSRKVPSKEKLYSYMIWIGLFIYGTFAMLIGWHPQWLVILSVFIALAIPQFSNNKLALYCDLGVQIMYLAISNIYYAYNVDNYMVNNGILQVITQHRYNGTTISQIAGHIDNVLPIVFSVFVGILIAFIYYAYKQVENPKLEVKDMQFERVVVWSRLAVMYVYCLLLCVFFFYLG